MKLPDLVNQITKNKISTVKMGSINYSDSYQDGDLEDSRGISSRRYPYVTNALPRSKVGTYSNVDSISNCGDLIVVSNGSFYVNGVLKGSVSTGKKQLVNVNTKVVIWPDKKYYDTVSGTLSDMGVSRSLSVTFTTDTITSSGANFTSYFKVGDGLTISGSSISANNKNFVVAEVTSTTIRATNTNVFTAGSSSITLARVIPDMDYICESENRLWGCSSSAQTVYASALGNPCNMQAYEGTADSSYAVAVGTKGNFTGISKYSSSVLFFKEDYIHKMLGSFPKEYTMYTYDVEGLQSGAYNSMRVINQVLYYKGVHGIFAYTGGSPTLISDFSDKAFTDSVGGEDGETYYLSCKEGSKNHLFAYNTNKGLWVHEDDVYVSDFTTIGTDVYGVIGGEVYKFNSTGTVGDWDMTFKPMYETLQGKKLYSKFILRVELPVGSYINLSIKEDDKPFRSVTNVVGNGSKTIRLPINRCDKFQIKLSGKGAFLISEILREFAIGSDV